MTFLKKATTRFQFPSNGKAYPKHVRGLWRTINTEFQFPSNGKAYPKDSVPHLRQQTLDTGMFQFPSNGKAYPKLLPLPSSRHLLFSVSIPFQRKAYPKSEVPAEQPAEEEFQFPSNGKAYPKELGRQTLQGIILGVSIPFQRESVPKAMIENYTEVMAEKVSIPFQRESVPKE